MIPAAVVASIVQKTNEYPRIRPADAPASVLYGGAHLFREGMFQKLGALARATFEGYVRSASDVVAVVGEAHAERAESIRARVAGKLSRAPLEDVRIDFEDGYGVRSDADEDADATRTGELLARALPDAPRFVGVRVRAFDRATSARAARTLLRVFEGLDAKTIPPRFVVTLPKVRGVADVAAFVELLDLVEEDRGLAAGTIGLELLVETPTALVDRDGAFGLPRLLDAGAGRVRSVHLGAYDLLSLLDVAGHAQHLAHPHCDAARFFMLAAAHGRARVVDGATTRLPLPKHKGAALGDAEARENLLLVQEALALHASNVGRALENGIHQGWDLHPSQLVARYLAMAAHYEEGLASSSARLRAFVGEAARATREGQTFDDAATAEGLLVFFARGIASGMLDRDDVLPTGLGVDEITTLDFPSIVARRG